MNTSREIEDAAKAVALGEAADRGWADVAAGRCDDIAEEDLDDFIGQLGVHAARARPAG